MVAEIAPCCLGITELTCPKHLATSEHDTPLNLHTQTLTYSPINTSRCAQQVRLKNVKYRLSRRQLSTSEGCLKSSCAWTNSAAKSCAGSLGRHGWTLYTWDDGDPCSVSLASANQPKQLILGFVLLHNLVIFLTMKVMISRKHTPSI